MLKTRIITACVLASAVIAGMFMLAPPMVGSILGLFLIVAAWEWSGLIGWQAVALRTGYTAVVSGLAVALWYWKDLPGIFPTLLNAAVIWWLVAGIFVVAAQRKRLGGGVALAANGAVGLLILLPAWSSIVWLLHNDPTMLLSLFSLVWVADAAAYFVGRRWGRRRLASNVSPGKSWEGVAGGLVFGGIVAVTISMLVVLSGAARMGFIVVALVAIVASIIGDLFESMVKRNIGVKDSGRILPGHGGVLDRIDGLVAAAPVFSAGLYFWVNRI